MEKGPPRVGEEKDKAASQPEKAGAKDEKKRGPSILASLPFISRGAPARDPLLKTRSSPSSKVSGAQNLVLRRTASAPAPAPASDVDSPFLALPDEIKLQIFEYLGPMYTGRLARVAKAMQRLCDDVQLWRRYLQGRWAEYHPDAVSCLSPSQLKQIYRFRAGELTWDSKRKSSGLALSEHDRAATADNSAWNTVRANQALTFGKWIWRIRTQGRTRPTIGIGIVGEDFKVWRGWAGNSSSGWVLDDTGKICHAAQTMRVCPPLKGTDVIGVFVDLDRRILGFYCNGRYVASVHNIPPVVYPACSLSGKNLTVTMDFDTAGYEFPAPSQIGAVLPATDAAADENPLVHFEVPGTGPDDFTL